jgi:branched-chain amino acid transport system ATP-binding protein
MMAEPRLVLLDEPGAGVNPTLMDELAAYIVHLARDRGVTILLIEHDMDLVMRLCDPVIVLSEGRPLVEGDFETVTHDPRVLEAYLGGD